MPRGGEVIVNGHRRDLTAEEREALRESARRIREQAHQMREQVKEQLKALRRHLREDLRPREDREDIDDRDFDLDLGGDE